MTALLCWLTKTGIALCRIVSGLPGPKIDGPKCPGRMVQKEEGGSELPPSVNNGLDSCLVTEHAHTGDQGSGIRDGCQSGVAVHDAVFRDAETTSTGSRNTSSRRRNSVSAKLGSRAGAGLFDDCEGVTALRTGSENAVD